MPTADTRFGCQRPKRNGTMVLHHLLHDTACVELEAIEKIATPDRNLGLLDYYTHC
jgi:hypothetical protein